jgi:hypothetical protein
MIAQNGGIASVLPHAKRLVSQSKTGLISLDKLSIVWTFDEEWQRWSQLYINNLFEQDLNRMTLVIHGHPTYAVGKVGKIGKRLEIVEGPPDYDALIQQLSQDANKRQKSIAGMTLLYACTLIGLVAGSRAFCATIRKLFQDHQVPNARLVELEYYDCLE